MKTFRVMFIVACFVIICALFSGVVSALEEDEATVTVILSSQTLYRGETIAARVHFESKYYEPILIGYVGLHFDWMASNLYLGHNLTDNPVTIPSFESCTFNVTYVTVSETTSVGLHSYYAAFEGIQGESTGFSWDSQIFTVTVYESAEEAYSALLTEVSSDIAEADNANYQSSAAESVLEQAHDAYDEAVGLAAEEKFGDAIYRLESASTYLEQIEADEQTSAEDNNLYALLLVIAVVAVLVIIFVFRRKKKRTARRRKK